MAHANIKTKKVIYLTLTEEEANWLMGLTQNQFESSEDKKSKKIREGIFLSLHKILKDK